MLQAIPAEFQDLLGDDVCAFAFLSTIMKDGSPQVTPVWFNSDDTHILINSAKGRTKDKNMRARPQVAIVIQDPKHHLRYIQIRGRVADVSEEGGYEHINYLSHKYDKKDFPKRPGQVRVIYKIVPEHVTTNNS